VSFDSAPTLDNKSYAIEATAMTFSHAEFTYTTTPRTHTLCGPIAYVVTLDSVAVTDITRPLAYDNVGATRQFTIYSTDPALKGTTADYVLSASFANYPSSSNPLASTATTAAATITFTDPCASLFSFASTSQTNPSSDSYTGAGIQFFLTKFTVSPSSCEDTITYTLQSVTGPGTLAS